MCTDRSKAVLFCGSHLLFIFCVCHAFLSGPCSLVVTCWEMATCNLLVTLVCDVLFVFCHFPAWCFELGMVLDCIYS